MGTSHATGTHMYFMASSPPVQKKHYTTTTPRNSMRALKKAMQAYGWLAGLPPSIRVRQVSILSRGIREAIYLQVHVIVLRDDAEKTRENTQCGRSKTNSALWTLLN